jgi:hypothetical protein
MPWLERAASLAALGLYATLIVLGLLAALLR